MLHLLHARRDVVRPYWDETVDPSAAAPMWALVSVSALPGVVAGRARRQRRSSNRQGCDAYEDPSHHTPTAHGLRQPHRLTHAVKEFSSGIPLLANQVVQHVSVHGWTRDRLRRADIVASPSPIPGRRQSQSSWVSVPERGRSPPSGRGRYRLAVGSPPLFSLRASCPPRPHPCS